MSDLQKFDPATLMQGVRDRIKSTFVSLIPDEQWESMIKKEIQEFFEPTKDRYNNYQQMSSFSKVCNEVLADITKGQISDILKKYESTIWNNNELVMSDTLKDLLLKNASEIFTAMIGNRIQTIIHELKNRVY